MMPGTHFGVKRTSVTGSMLSKFQDKEVRLIGQVVKSGPVNTLEINTGDNVIVTVKLLDTLDEPVEGLVDVQGRVINRNTVEGNFMILPEDLAAKFDLQVHSEAIMFTANFDNPWTLDS